MSELKKVVVVVRNSRYDDSTPSMTMYENVRVENEQGKTVYYKKLVVPAYLKKHGAVVEGMPRIWFIKNISKKVTVLLAYQKPDGKIEYDLDEIKLMSRGSYVTGLKFALAAVPASVVVAVATYGVGLLIFPLFAYYAYRSLLTVPAMLSHKTLSQDFSKFGVSI